MLRTLCWNTTLLSGFLSVEGRVGVKIGQTFTLYVCSLLEHMAPIPLVTVCCPGCPGESCVRAVQ